MNEAISGVRALTFDVFGTVVDWRGSVISAGSALKSPAARKVDWAKFADRWRMEGYRDAIARANREGPAWTRVDELHLRKLTELVRDFGLEDLSEAQIHDLNGVWHRLKPWPDSVEGLQRLKKRLIVSTLSNGDVALLTNMAKHSGLPWDCVLSAELVGHYKPTPVVYRKAAEWLGLEPSQVMMVAAHTGDLAAARKEGLRTALVKRPLEYGDVARADLTGEAWMDVVADDMNDLANKLGC